MPLKIFLRMEGPSFRIFIQARMTSSRLPGKVLMPLNGKPVLAWVVDRLTPLKLPLTVLTSEENADLPIELWCKQNEVDCFRGNLNDVLDRFKAASLHRKADFYIRITADCPLIFSDVIQLGINITKWHFNQKISSNVYCSNSICRTFPRGLDFEIFSYELLEKAHEKAKLDFEKEHVTPFMYLNSKGAHRIYQITNAVDLSYIRITLDTMEDYEVIHEITKNYAKLLENYPTFLSGIRQISTLFSKNQHINQKEIK